MKLAIMQPYFFPYIGYWQLLSAADRFVIYDDVNYIKGGWVNRNRLLINGAPSYITVPLSQPSPYRKICDTALHPSNWREGLVRMVSNTYRRAPYFSSVFPLVEKLIRHEASLLSDYLANQILELAGFMGIGVEVVTSSRRYDNDHLSGEARVLDICSRERATHYINAEGGRELYSDGAFQAAGLKLSFLRMKVLPYPQRHPGFVSHLSIVDALMEVGPAGMRDHLESYDLVEGLQADA